MNTSIRSQKMSTSKRHISLRGVINFGESVIKKSKQQTQKMLSEAKKNNRILTLMYFSVLACAREEFRFSRAVYSWSSTRKLIACQLLMSLLYTNGRTHN